MTTQESYSEESIHRLFKSLIAKQAGVSETDITPEWIVYHRQNDIYPDALWWQARNKNGLRILTQREATNIHHIANSLMRKCLR